MKTKLLADRATPFRIYSNCPVDISYQNFGSVWLVILRGKEQDIEATFNGFFNFGATNGDLDFHDGEHTIGTFWTKEENLRWAFATIRLNHYLLKGRGQKAKGRKGGFWNKALNAAEVMMGRLKQRHEPFISYSSTGVESFSTGTVRAEKPDYDGKDLILFSAFQNQGESISEPKSLDEEGKESVE